LIERALPLGIFYHTQQEHLKPEENLRVGVRDRDDEGGARATLQDPGHERPAARRTELYACEPRGYPTGEHFRVKFSDVLLSPPSVNVAPRKNKCLRDKHTLTYHDIVIQK